MSNQEKNKKPIGRKETDRLYDIKHAIRGIHSHPKFSQGYKAWQQDEYFRGYCERQLSIIGESASRLCVEHKYNSKYPTLEWALIKGLRTVLVHVYWKIDPDMLWGIIENHLPELEKYVNNWLKQKEKELKENPPEKNQPMKESKLRRKLREIYPKDSKEPYKIRETS